MDRPERLSLQSADGAQLNLDALYQIAPSCFTEAADPKTGGVKRVVNFDILRQLLGDDAVEDAPEAYEFNWVGKQAARAEVLRSISKTLRPVREDSVDWDTTQNLYIEGDNLEVLKLLQKSYLGKVKMIYIDPPYNTGNDFVYRDDFARSQAEEDLFAGNVDELGNRFIKNTDSNGRYHSDWCSMIYSRLMVARSLLTEDGVIFISIDQNEVTNLQKICKEIFGDDQTELYVWDTREPGTLPKTAKKTVRNDNEFIVAAYKQNKSLSKYSEQKYLDKLNEWTNPDNDPRGPWMSANISRGSGASTGGSKSFVITNPNGISFDRDWAISEDEYNELLADNRIYFSDGGNGVPRKKIFATDTVESIQSSIFEKLRSATSAAQELENMMGGKLFDFPKPVNLLRRMISIGSEKDSIVLDFFSGSGTIAQAVIAQNAEDGACRKFICVQLQEETPEDSEARKAGYKTIPEIAKVRIRRAGKKIKEESPLTTQDLDTGFRVFRVDSSNYEEVEHTPKDWNQDQLDLFLNNIKADRTDLDLLFGCMLDWGVQLSLPMTTEEVDGKNIYTVNEGDLVACFADKVTDNVVRAMAEKQPLRVIFRDSCFERDADKINIYETFKQLMDWSDQEVVKNIRVI